MRDDVLEMKLGGAARSAFAVSDSAGRPIDIRTAESVYLRVYGPPFLEGPAVPLQVTQIDPAEPGNRGWIIWPTGDDAFAAGRYRCSLVAQFTGEAFPRFYPPGGNSWLVITDDATE